MLKTTRVSQVYISDKYLIIILVSTYISKHCRFEINFMVYQLIEMYSILITA